MGWFDPWLISGSAFWILMVWLTFATLGAGMCFYLMQYTPGGTFLRAKLNRKPVAYIKFRSGACAFKVANDSDPGSMDVKGLGFVMMTEGSQVLEKLSKVPVYEVFSEYGASIPAEYAATVQELKSKGFIVNTFDDYKLLLDLASNKKFAEDYIQKFENEEEKKKATEFVNKVKSVSVELKPYKTYKVNELAFMFPNNISPVYVHAKVQSAVNRKISKLKMQNQLLIYGAIAFLIIIIGAAIAYKFYAPCNPQVIIQSMTQPGVIAATNLTA